jgi:hypothetical protein
MVRSHASGKWKTGIVYLLGTIGVSGIITVVTYLNTATTRWNAIPGLQTALSESQADRKNLHDTLTKHESDQNVQMTEVRMTLKSIETVQEDQKEALKSIERKLDRTLGSSNSAMDRFVNPEKTNGG